MNWAKVALFAGGALFGSAGIEILTSKDAKKLYSARPHLNPPPVLPALAPITIRHSRIAFEKLGHRSKSVVANPVVVIILAT